MTNAQAKELPLSWEWKDQPQAVLWELPSHSKIFFAQWDDLKIALARADQAADRGSAVAARDVSEIKPLVQQKLCMARVALFYISATPLPLKMGDVEVTFENGDVVKDQGILFWEQEKAGSDKYNSRNGSINLSRRWRKSGEPLLLRILLPDKYLGQKIKSVALPVS
ncbi:hypothetical protein C4566_01915 [Candidatus Parcubacteria bacterium]|nr:MAG: hypothetical protein C4566_01915 [Candidatus Parcubacteria bacterium]